MLCLLMWLISGWHHTIRNVVTAGKFSIMLVGEVVCKCIIRCLEICGGLQCLETSTRVIDSTEHFPPANQIPRCSDVIYTEPLELW